MALTIATNIGALNAATAAHNTSRSMETSMERLSTGKRVNSATDDVAGIGIASRMTAEVRGSNQAIRNALDAQALTNTADGAHKEVDNILQRMREVAVQAANDTNNDQDRANLQVEIDSLISEVDRISSNTTWAGAKLMSGSNTSFSFHVGAAPDITSNQINVSIDGMGSKNLGLAASSGIEVTNAGIKQAAYDALVATKGTTATASVAAGADLIGKEAGALALAAIQTGNNNLDNDGATPEKQAAALRDILVGQDAAIAAGVASGNMPPKSDQGMDFMAADLQVVITGYLADQTEQTEAQGKLDNFTAAITAFKASTTNDTALSTFNDVQAKYELVIAQDISDSATADATVSGATLKVLVATNSHSTGNARAATVFPQTTTTGLDTLALAVTDLKANTNQGIAGDVTTINAAVVTAKAALVTADSAASAASAAVTASNDPADLKGQGLSVADGANARTSITTIDAAISAVSSQRSKLGAVSNRLDHTINNLTNVASNTSSARGRIEDADYAMETTNLAKNQILQRASVAMLSQANASKGNVLGLLRG